ncbi:monocarboxylate transporter 7-like isoform X2 [Patiria miniata]|nr:monocarboxylate transporter 7-like isoform X2 [Patiria miniata]
MSFVSSPLFERFGHRKIIILGVVLAIAGILATSFTHALWQIYLTFGIIFAIGLNFLCNPSLNMMTVYFPGRNCARATLIANSGQTVGTLLLTPLFEAAFSQIGWRKSLQILSAVIFLTCLPLAMVFKPPNPRPIKLDQEASLSPEEKEKLNMVDVNTHALTGEMEEAACRPKDKDEDCDSKNRLKESFSAIERRLSREEEPISADTGASGDEFLSAETATTLIPSNDEKSPMSEARGENERATDEGESIKQDEKPWQKYINLIKDPIHWFFFLGILLVTVTIVFNSVNLVSCMTTGGIAEPTAAWLVTLLCVTDVVFRVALSIVGDRLPVKILLISAVCVVGAAGSFLLTRGTSLWIFVVYSVVAGIERATIFGTGFACAVELFGANRAVESLTSIMIAFGIGGLLASSVAGLSYDLTGTYQTTHYTCLGIWVLSGSLFVIVYKWRLISHHCRSHKSNRSHIENDI